MVEVAMSTKTNKISAAAWALPRTNLKFCSRALRESPPNCLEIGGRPWRLSGSYEHVTDSLAGEKDGVLLNCTQSEI